MSPHLSYPMMMTEPPIAPFKPLRNALMLIAVLMFAWGIWAVPVLSHNEARRMVVVHEMLDSGNWLLPTMNGEVYLAKPPLLYWLMAATCKLVGSQAEWAMRLPTSLMAIALIALFLNRASRSMGQGPALIGAAILLSSESFIEFARSAQIEMLLTLTSTVSVFCFLDYLTTNKKAWLMLSYAALGAAILTKGPVALLFITLPILVFGLIRGDRAVFGGLASIWGWAMAGLIALPWFAYLFLGHKALLDHVINEDIAGKIAGVSKRSPLYTYPLFLIGAFAPWLLVVCYRPQAVIKTMWARYQSRYFLLVAVVPVVVMSLISEKHGKYLLPLFPCLAMVLGLWCHHWYQGVLLSGPRQTPRWPLALIALLLSGHFLFQVVLTPRLYGYRFSALGPMASAINRQAKGRAVYCHNEELIQLICAVGHPLPVKKTAELKARVEAGESFLLVSTTKDWGELADQPLCLIEEFSPFLKKDRAARLLGSGEFCTPRLPADKQAVGQ